MINKDTELSKLSYIKDVIISCDTSVHLEACRRMIANYVQRGIEDINIINRIKTVTSLLDYRAGVFEKLGV